MLREHGGCGGSGSACAAETATPSRVLTAQGINSEIAFGTLRVSFARTSTVAEVDIFLDTLTTVIQEW